MRSVSFSTNIIPNALVYVLLIIRTILFLVVFKQSIQMRKSLTANKKQSDSAKEARLMQTVLVFCGIYVLMSRPRAFEKIMDTTYIDTNLRPGRFVRLGIPSYVQFVLLVLHASSIIYFSIFLCTWLSIQHSGKHFVRYSC